MAERVELHVVLDADGEHITFTMHRGDQRTWVKFDAATVDKFVRDVCSYRARMNEKVPPELDPNARLETIVFPVWQGEENRSDTNKRIAIRHPGYGWTSYLLSQEQVTAMASYLAPKP
jgi:hypothetical protein